MTGSLRAKLFWLAVAVLWIAAIISVAVGISRIPRARRPSHAPVQPIKADVKAITQRDFLKARTKWYHDTFVEAYKKVGRKNVAWDEAALRLLDLSARSEAQAGDEPTGKQLLEAAQPLVKTTCDDPLVLYCIGTALYANGKFKEADPYLRRATKGFETVKYPRCRAWSAPCVVWWILRDSNADINERQQWGTQMINWMAESAAEPEVTQGAQRQLWKDIEIVMREASSTARSTLSAALAAQPGADPWVGNVLNGELYIEYAWQSRGSGWASEVTEAGWKGFEENLAKARKCLTAAWTAHPEYPEAPTRMITVVKGGGPQPGESARLWFDRAVAAQFDYEDAYLQYRDALLPRWGGSHEEMYQFGLECLHTKRFDTCVPDNLFEYVWFIAEYDNAEEYWRDEGVYNNLKAMFEGILAEPSRAAERPTKGSKYAAVAWRTGHYEDSLRVIRTLKGDFIPSAFLHFFDMPFSLAKGQMIAATGPQAARVKQAEQLYQAEKHSEALSRFEQLLKENKDESVTPYLEDRIASLRIEEVLARDTWVDLMPPKDLAGWHRTYGNWTVTSDGGVECTPGQQHNAGPALVCNARVPKDYEIRGDAEMPTGFGVAGIVFGYHFGGAPYWTSAQMDRKKNLAILGAGFSAEQKKNLPLKDTNHFLAQVWHNRVSYYLNDVCIGSDLDMTESLKPPGRHVGFGSWRYEPTDKPVRYRNVQIRRLTKEPEAP